MTNVSAQIALQTLRNVNTQLEESNTRVSTGLRINSAKDGAAYWAIATTTRSDNGSLGAVKDALGIGKSTVDTATTGLSKALDTLGKISDLLISAQVPENDRGIIQGQIDDLLKELEGNADSANTSGNNWLSVDSSLGSYNATKQVVASFTRNGDAVATQTMSIDTRSMKLYDANKDIHSTVDATVDTTQSAYDAALDTAQSAYDAAITAADDAYETAVNAAQSAYSASDKTAADDATLTAALVAADTAKESAYDAAYDTRKDALNSANTFAADLEGQGNNKLGIFDKIRVASTDAGFATAVAIKDIDVGSLKNASEANLATIANYLSIVDQAMTDLKAAQSTLGSTASRIDSQTNYVQSLIDTNDRSIGTLVDADMEEESTKLKAIQTQQQLAIQSLSIANSASQNVLTLFR